VRTALSQRIDSINYPFSSVTSVQSVFKVVHALNRAAVPRTATKHDASKRCVPGDGNCLLWSDL
jgi:hypothetical protein